MKEQLRQYILTLCQNIPTDVIEGLISIFCLGAVGLTAFLGWKKGLKKVAGLFLAEYIVFIYSLTVICRIDDEKFVGYNFRPLWSYEAIQNGRYDLIAENLMNVVMFVPIGVFLGFLLRTKRSWLITLIVGLCISITIEALQFYLKRGYSEVDDVMHNTIGCLIGFMVLAIIKGAWRLLNKKTNLQYDCNKNHIR